jgi:hypothetical protein
VTFADYGYSQLIGQRQRLRFIHNYGASGFYNQAGASGVL